jgi:arsenate reductase
MITIYHNPRCRKSREGLAVVESSGKDFEVIKYLEKGLTTNELQDIIKKLDIPPLELVRKNEIIWKENYKGRELTDNEIIEAMSNHPKLMERPVIINGENAVIGRPSSTISSIL